MLAKGPTWTRRFEFLLRLLDLGLHEFSEREIKALIFFAVLGYAEDKQLAGRDRKLLADNLGVTERSTFAVLQPLVERGCLLKTHTGRYVFYRLNLEWRP